MIKEALLAIGLPVGRSVIGWIKNSLKNGKIQLIEWKLLAETVLSVGTIATVAYFGLNSLGLDFPVLAASAGAFLFDMILSAYKKKNK